MLPLGKAGGDMAYGAMTGQLQNITPEMIIPRGIIAMWSGAANAIPDGWLLCNGSNGTPDLRNRFIVGAGSTYDVGDTGGAQSVKLTTAQMPSHSHTATFRGNNTGSAGAHTHSVNLGSSSFNGKSLKIDERSQYDVLTNIFPTRFGYVNESDSNNETRVMVFDRDSSMITYDSRLTFRPPALSGGSTNSTGAHTHTTSGTVTNSSTGSGSSHENRPPYYALCYIMKS